MLAFMRKHQKYFFVIITIVIVITFSFFGTYSTLAGNSIHEETAFKTMDGQSVTRAELEEMALFLGTDADDKRLFGGVWGPNFLNDGVIRKDFLETGLAALLIQAYGKDLQGDLKNRFMKEQHYRPYAHPQAPFISSKNAWKYFAPQITTELETLQGAANPLAPSAVDARVQLFLLERRFPAPYLKQLLRYQEDQSGWVQKDPALDQHDLSLFGYHTLEDWFGTRFIRLISEFIFNAAAIAEERGYQVSKEEALADLMRNAEISFKENRSNAQLGVATGTEYLDQQLMRMRFDKPKAIKIWQRVLLFRRLFGNVGGAAFIDPTTFTIVNAHANEGVEGDLYRIPDALRFSNFADLQRFETYLDLVSKRSKEERAQLAMPKVFLTPEEVAIKAPELVQKKYELEVASISKKALEDKVSAKHTLAWELENKNWELLKKQFPELGVNQGANPDERLSSIEKLDFGTRSRVDRFAREQIVASHPEWVEEGLKQAALTPVQVNIAKKGPNAIFEGLVSADQLLALLDEAELGKESVKLQKLTFDNDHYYHIVVMNRAPHFEIMTFAEAKKGALIDQFVNQALEVSYVKVRSEDPAVYQNSDKSWKPLDQVKEKVALVHFKGVLDSIRTKLGQRKDQEKYQNLTGDRLAAYRFAGWAEDVKKILAKDPAKAEEFVHPDTKTTFSEQFKWQKQPLRITRKSDLGLAESDKLLQLGAKQWSETVLSPNGEVYFAFVTGPIGSEDGQELLQDQINRSRFLLGNDAMRSYLRTLIPLMKDKNAISFEYLHADETSIENEG